MFFKTYVVLIVFVLCFFCGCKKDNSEDFGRVDRMVLVYMAANNDLRSEAIDCINRMEVGYSKNFNLLVYIKTSSENSFILKIKYDNTDDIVSDTLAVYRDENSSDPAFLSLVVKDARRLSPARSYGLILWSHASSWAPPLGPSLKSFGEDRRIDMDIVDMRLALPTDFSYIIFDACSMASIETIYELKDNAAYILASPSEVLSTSYPYEQIIPYLFGGEQELKLVGQKFVDYYQSLTGDYASATVSLIETRHLYGLAEKTRALLDNYKLEPDFSASKIQRLDFDFSSRVPAYDFLDFLEYNYNFTDYNDISNQLEKVVVFKAYTSAFLGNPIKKFSGLSVYLPTLNDVWHDYYRNLSWYEEGGAYNLFQ